MQLLKWLSVTDRFYKIYLDKQLAPYGINNSQYMFLIKICRSPGILQDSLLNMFYVHPSNIVRTVATLEKQPGANVLVATKKDFEPQNRKKFCSRIATGDYDAIVIGHSQFEKIPLSPERQKTFLQVLARPPIRSLVSSSICW